MVIRLIGLFVIALALLSPLQAQSQAESFILNQPTVDLNEGRISFDLVIRQQKYFSVPDLTEANFNIGEPHEELDVTSQPTLPLTLAIVVDMSLGSDATLIRNTLRAYFDSYYMPEDDVTLYILNGNSDQPNVIPITSLEQSRTEIENLQMTRNFYTLTPAFTRVAEDLKAKPIGLDHPAHVLYVGTLLSNPREQRASTIFRDAGYPFHAIQAHSNRQDFTTEYRTLANTGGGLFSNNLGGIFVLSSDDALTPFSPINTLKVLYDTINDSRQFYRVRYRTLNRSLEAQRTIPLTITLSNGQQVSQQFTYEWTFQTPIVEFVNPDELNPIRRPFRDSVTGDIGFDIEEQNVHIQVSFPDGIQRDVSSLRWEVLDTGTDQIIQSDLIQNPTLENGGRFTIPWPINNGVYNLAGNDLNVAMRVIITDEMNLTAEAQQEGIVTIFPAPTIPAPTLPPPTPAPPTAVPTVEARVTTPVLQGGAVAVNPVIYGAILGVIILLLVALIVFVIRYWRLTRIQNQRIQEMERRLQTTQAAQQTVVADNVEPEKLDKPLVARLYVTAIDSEEKIKGLENGEIWINTEEFIIGRSTDATHQIEADFISPRHCKIFRVNRQYYVTDLNSKNGTYVNGDPIIPNQNVLVPIGSEIGITRKITVEIWDPDTVLNVEQQAILRPGTAYPTMPGQLIFKPLPGVVYAEDPNAATEDNYSPI